MYNESVLYKNYLVALQAHSILFWEIYPRFRHPKYFVFFCFSDNDLEGEVDTHIYVSRPDSAKLKDFGPFLFKGERLLSTW